MGILKGSLYHYVQTKEELLYVLLKEGHRRATSTIEDHRHSSATLSAEPRLLSFIRLWMDRSRYLDFAGLGGESHDYTMFLTEPHRAEIRGIRREVAGYLAEVISSDSRSGFLRDDIDSGVASRSLLVIMNATHEWIGDYSDQWDDVADWYVRLFFAGICVGEQEGDETAQRGREVAGLRARATKSARLEEAPPVPQDLGLVRAERWDELVEIAAEVFAEKTYPGASLSEIAKRMGIRKASLYHYIQTKEELLFELQLRAHERGLALIRSGSLDDVASGKEWLASFILRWADGLSRLNSSYIPLGRPDFQFMTNEHSSAIRAMRRAIRDHLTELIEQGVADGSFHPEINVTYLTNSLFLSLNRSIRWFHLEAQNPSIGAWHVRLFLEGLASPEWKHL
jgi:AcrR family transcriptional regulator